MELQINNRVVAARNDRTKEEELIRDYIPFIKSETSLFAKKTITDNDDELSIAMMAFHEAIHNYDKDRGTFVSYASLIIQNRLIDYYRKEKRHLGNMSFYEYIGRDDSIILENLVDDSSNRYEEMIYRETTKKEILELTRNLREYGVSLEDVAANCPKQYRSKRVCIKVMQYARKNEDILKEFLATKKLPVSRLVNELGVPRKTLEKHRKYLVALFVVCTNGYEIIREHLKQIMKEDN